MTHIQTHVIEKLKAARLPLIKWVVSNEELLKNIPKEDQEEEFPFSDDSKPTIKMLGNL